MMKVAIVDDHQLFRKSLAVLVGTFDGVEVVFDASEGGALVSYLEDNQVDLVLLDIQMPGMNGFETCKILKKEYPEVMILIISQLTTRESIHEIMNLGAHGYFTKNSDPAQLEQAIRSMHERGYYFGMELGNVIREAILWEKSNLKRSTSDVSFTSRELEIIKLVCAGYGTSQIADELCITVRTVETHRNRIMTKTDSRNFIGVVLFALKSRMLSLEELTEM